MKDNHLSYKPTPSAADKIEKLRQQFIDTDNLIDEIVGAPVSSDTVDVGTVLRYKSLAKTALEEARMWAVNSVVRANNTGPNELQGTVNGADQAKAV